MSANRTGLAICIVITAAFFNSLDAVIVRMLAGEVHPLMIGFFRSFFGLLAILPWLVRGVNLTASPFRLLHVLRAGLKFAALAALFVAFAHAPLADAVAINFTMPVFLVFGAWLFLGEKIGVGSVIGVLVGLLGVAIIIRPGNDGQGANPWLLFALGGAILTAASQLLLRRMAQHDTTDRLVAWNLVTMVPLGLIASVPSGRPRPGRSLGCWRCRECWGH